MAMEASEIERMIKAAFPDAVVEIKDLAGDGDHYACVLYTYPSPRDVEEWGFGGGGV